MAETALYPPIKAFLEARGFAVKGEVCGCDVVGTRPGEPPLLVIAELKLSFTLELVLQAVDRMRSADEVWLATVATRKGRDRDRRVVALCRLLGVGLLLVAPAGSVTVAAQPAPYQPRPNLKRRRRLLAEHGRRQGDPALGGSTRSPIMTAYRQRTLAVAAAMRGGLARPRDLVALAPDAAAILQRNVYGWFIRTRPGHYALTPAGEAALRRWPPTPMPANRYRFQCPDCGMSDGELGELHGEHEIHCPVCLTEDNRHVVLRRWPAAAWTPAMRGVP